MFAKCAHNSPQPAPLAVSPCAQLSLAALQPAAILLHNAATYIGLCSVKHGAKTSNLQAVTVVWHDHLAPNQLATTAQVDLRAMLIASHYATLNAKD